MSDLDPDVSAAFGGAASSGAASSGAYDSDVAAAFGQSSEPAPKRMPDGSLYTGQPWQDALLKSFQTPNSRDFGLTARNVIEGAAGVVTAPLGAIAQGLDLIEHPHRLTLDQLNPFSAAGQSTGSQRNFGQELSQGLTRIGLPTPQTPAERIAAFGEQALTAPIALGLLRAPPGSPESAIEPDTGPAGMPSKPSAPSVSDDILANSRKAGYVVPPATTNPNLLNRGVEAFAGKASVAQAASIKNQAITNGLARKALDLPEDAQLTPDTLAASRAPANAVYEQVKGAGPIQVDPQYHSDLQALTKTGTTIQRDLPSYSSGSGAQIKALSDSLVPPSGTIDAETAVELSKDLRYNASANFSAAARNGDPNLKTLAAAQRDAAGAVEDLVGRHLESNGQPELSQAWDDARKHIAKTYSVQNALDGAGNVDATKLGKQLLKGKPLSDELETAANFANAFPKAARVLPGKESMPGMSPLDVYGSVAASLASGSPAPMLLGPGRMAARSAALSSLLQPKK